MRRFFICLFGFLLPVLAAPAIYDGGVVNGADFTLNFSPGMLVSVFGTNLATATKLAPGFPLPTAIDGVSVEVVDGTRTLNAPLFFVSAGQINAQLPFDITSASVQVRVKNATGTSAAQTIAIVARCPRLLTKAMNGRGEAILTHADYTVVSSSAPALAGEVVVLYMAGLGVVSPSIAAGQAAGTGTATNPLNVVQDEVVVKVGGVAAKVHYKGLAPYFAGLYQINFQVPEETQQGPALISVETGAQASQQFVTFSCAIGWEKLGSAAVSSSGGSVTAAGLTLTVPSGSFAEPREVRIYRAATGIPADEDRAGPVYGIGGLPATFTTPITVTVDVPGASAVPGDAYVVLQQPGPAGGEVYLRATVAGDRVTATIPARLAATPKATALARRHADDPYETYAENMLLSIILGIQETQGDSGLFQLIYGATLDKDRVIEFTSALKAAYEKLLTWGFEWTGSRPIKVRLGPKNVYSLNCGGQIVPTLWNGPSTIRVDRDILKPDKLYPEDLTRLKAKAAHLVFHLIQSQYGPAMNYEKPYAWLWMDEAAAGALESSFGWRDPELRSETPLLSPHLGLERSATSDDVRELYEHGRRAAAFLTDRMAKLNASDATWLANAYNRRKGTSSPPAPVKAMQDVQINAGEEWLAYCRTKREDLFIPLYGGAWDHNFSGGRSRKLENVLNKPLTFTASLPDLSAQFFQVVPPDAWPANAELYISISGPIGLVVDLYRMQPISEYSSDRFIFAELGNGGSSILIKSPGSVCTPKDFLALMVYNPRAVSPFTTTTPITITVVLRAPQASFLPSLRTMTRVSASIDAAPVCTIDKDFQSLGLCPRALLLANDRVAVAGRAPFNPVSWDREFTASDAGTLAGVSTNYTMSFKLSESGDAMQSAKVESTATWRQAVGTKTYSMERKMSFSVADIPHVIPIEPSSSTLLHSFQVLPLNGAQPKNLLSWSYTITADGTVVGSVTGIDWTKSLLADGKAVPRQSGTPGISIRFDK